MHALQLIKARTISSGFADDTYNGLDAFYLTYASGITVPVRWSAVAVQPFVAEHKLSYPILLDPGRKVNELFVVNGIPRSLIYDRNGKLAAEAIDMRTQKQLLALLARAGLR